VQQCIACVCADTDVPQFNGSSYIVFPPLRTSREIVVTVELRPEALDGLLLYNADVQSQFKDFVAIALIHGHLELRFLFLKNIYFHFFDIQFLPDFLFF